MGFFCLFLLFVLFVHLGLFVLLFRQANHIFYFRIAKVTSNQLKIYMVIFGETNSADVESAESVFHRQPNGLR